MNKVLILSRVFSLIFSIFQLNSSLACDAYLKPFELECQLQDRYRAVELGLRDEFGVNVNYLSEYRALRLMEFKHWNKGKEAASYCPWPIYQPAPLTWDRWEQGANYVDQSAKRMNDSGVFEFNLDHLVELHQAAMTQELFRKRSMLLKGAAPGKIRTLGIHPKTPEFFIECKHRSLDKNGYDILSHYDLKDHTGKKLVRMYNDQACKDEYEGFYSGHVRYMRSQHVVPEVRNLLTLFSIQLNSYRKGSVSSSNERLKSEEVLWIPDELASYFNQESSPLSPIDFSADIQRRYISMHPFGDGNGRTSHFLQDLLLRSLGLPYAPTGHLTYELIYRTKDYRQKTRTEMVSQVERLEKCLGQYRAGSVSPECKAICRTKSQRPEIGSLHCGKHETEISCEELETGSRKLESTLLTDTRPSLASTLWDWFSWME